MRQRTRNIIVLLALLVGIFCTSMLVANNLYETDPGRRVIAWVNVFATSVAVAGVVYWVSDLKRFTKP